MTIAHRLPARNKYKCDICGKIDFWGDGWSRYSSGALDDCCPDEAPTTCSDECYIELMARIKKKTIQLPKLRATPGYFVISKNRVGY